MELERILNDKNRKWWFCTIQKQQKMFESGLIGFNDTKGDKNLTQYGNIEQLKKDYNNTKVALYLWDFYKIAKEGDIVFIGNGQGNSNTKIKTISKIAIIEGDYFYVKEDYHHRRKVEYLEEVNLKDFDFKGTKNIYFAEIDREYKEKLYNILIKNNSTSIQSNPPLNQILYGPPGTGKTYHTIDKALEIFADPKYIDFLNDETRVELLEVLRNKEAENRRERMNKLFDLFKDDEYIQFMTFHQSYSYEEFVEGIKPKANSNELHYEISDGIFKKMCDFPIPNIDEELEGAYQNYLDKLYQPQDQNRLIAECKEMRLPLHNINGVNFYIVRHSKNGIWAVIDKPYGFYYFSATKKNFMHYFKTQSFYRNKNSYAEYIFDEIIKNHKLKKDFLLPQDKKPRVLIIDEINRGNISKIFGELITLIEPSKRIGESEELRVILPYSQNLFGVPSNLYIIGTMNTADRSITSIDTALRRRFEFEKMMPDPSKLNNNMKGINLIKMLEAINERIEYLCGREKTIGHAYLIEVDSLQSLKNAFQNKIIPLLQEYFYNDYEAISAVLNDNGMIRDDKDFTYIQGSFKTFTDNRGMNEKKIFAIANKDNEKVWGEPNTYKKIYGEEDTKQENTPNNQDSIEQA